MPQEISEDELEVQPNLGIGQLLAMSLCLGMSFLCSLLWVFLLLWPQMLKSFQG